MLKGCGGGEVGGGGRAAVGVERSARLQIAAPCALQSLTSLSQSASGTLESQRLQTSEQPIRLQP